MRIRPVSLLQFVVSAIFFFFVSFSSSYDIVNEVVPEEKSSLRRKLPPLDNTENLNCINKKKMIWSVKNEYIFLNNQPFIFKGYTLAGLETPDMFFSDMAIGPNNPTKRSVEAVLDWLVEEEFNTIKIPLSISYALRESGGYTFQDLDEVVLKAQDRGIMILFSINNITPTMVKNSLWYNKYFSESSYLDGITRIVERYSNEWNFMGIDLMDEPYGAAQWGSDDDKDDQDENNQKKENVVLPKPANPVQRPLVTDLYRDELQDIRSENELKKNANGGQTDQLSPLAVAKEEVSKEDEYYNVVNFYERAMIFISEMVPNYKGLFLVQGTFWGEYFGSGATKTTTVKVKTGIPEIDARVVYSPQIYSPLLRNVDIYQNYLPNDGPNFTEKYGFITSSYKSPILISKLVVDDVSAAKERDFLDYLQIWMDDTCQPGIIYDSKGSSQRQTLQMAAILKKLIPYPSMIQATSAGPVKKNANVCINQGMFKNNAKCISNLPSTFPPMVRDRSIELPVTVLDVSGYIDNLQESQYPEDVAKYERPSRQDLKDNRVKDDDEGDNGIINPPTDDIDKPLTDDDLTLPSDQDDDIILPPVEEEDDDDDDKDSDYLGDGLPLVALANIRTASRYTFVFGIGPVRLIEIDADVQNTGKVDACQVIINVPGLSAAMGNRLTAFRGVAPYAGDQVILTQPKLGPGKVSHFTMTIPSGNFSPVYPTLSVRASTC